VHAVMFIQPSECPSCCNIRKLLEETTSLSDRIDLIVYDLVGDQNKAGIYGVELGPAVIVKKETTASAFSERLPATSSHRL